MTMRQLNDEICEELSGAEEYIHKAIHYKEKEDSTHMEMFYKMCLDELRHAENFMELAKEKCEKGKSDISQDLWEYMREKAMKKKEEIQYYIAVLKM
jgi:hypothetical protein